MNRTAEEENPRLAAALVGLDRAAAGLADLADPAEIAQEKLDFIAATAGLKPVFVAGRGIDAPGWRAALRDLAGRLALEAAEGPLWDATPWQALPRWYADHCQAALAGATALYIWTGDAAADEADAAWQSQGRLSQAAEARLLGFPSCCVAAHYDRTMRYHRATLSILGRIGANDPARMATLLAGNANMAPATDDEIDDLDAAYDIRPAPFGSWNMCRACAESENSPSAALSRRYEDLARSISSDLAGVLAPGSLLRKA